MSYISSKFDPIQYNLDKMRQVVGKLMDGLGQGESYSAIMRFNDAATLSAASRTISHEINTETGVLNIHINTNGSNTVGAGAVEKWSAWAGYPSERTDTGITVKIQTQTLTTPDRIAPDGAMPPPYASDSSIGDMGPPSGLKDRTLRAA